MVEGLRQEVQEVRRVVQKLKSGSGIGDEGPGEVGAADAKPLLPKEPPGAP